jgi:hypothetical protein
LQAVKCHAASSESKAAANPSEIYAILPKIPIDAIFSNILTEIISKDIRLLEIILCK